MICMWHTDIGIQALIHQTRVDRIASVQRQNLVYTVVHVSPNRHAKSKPSPSRFHYLNYLNFFHNCLGQLPYGKRPKKTTSALKNNHTEEHHHPSILVGVPSFSWCGLVFKAWGKSGPQPLWHRFVNVVWGSDRILECDVFRESRGLKCVLGLAR